MNREIRQSAASSATPRTPFQAPAVDRSPTAPARAAADTPGAEANWEVPWTLIGHGAKGMLDAWLSRKD
ncbi:MULTISPECIES: hypothetical protein [unclassified Streptomyces]|uniref:hypothetical protein n=1 Tax=unclassified Streptomyces TaxID=2593676 RepID=UPI002E104EDD|nr:MULTISPECIES: hypothetical protein [unclassified Streptomyces]WSR23992.1 hypothetical protein OG573_36325 [Streptomyces sp. NBC_01205]